MPATILNVGSLNVDYVYAMPHFVRAGETLASTELERHAGGKGLNQSIALARAGAAVRHLGAIGPDGLFLRDLLAEAGADISAVHELESPSGHAIIQIEPSGQNAILLYGGANQALSSAWLDAELARLSTGSFVLTQNETNLTAQALREARERGAVVVWNPAPITPDCESVDLRWLDYLVVNEGEAEALSDTAGGPGQALAALCQRAPHLQVVVTLGGQGVVTAGPQGRYRFPAAPVARVVDTTAAGDTFIGYLVASLARQDPLPTALQLATRAAAWSVQRKGAAPSIPHLAEL
ncbi:MAG: ribokinase [Verrucomicrobiota bacterium JB022]|nr:ribokinase [Verrucomicrobiota bacterium JB022]